jgi:hypothetical protein
MTSAADNPPENWGELGPAMKALPNERWRNFVRDLITGRPGRGALTRAARKAGFGTATTKPSTLSKHAHNLSRDERVIAAIAEESQKIIRVGHPEAVAALFNLIRDPKHRDHARAVAMVIDRCDPAVTRHAVDVTHRVDDPDREALEELRALRKLGTVRAKLLELYGPNGLDRLEALDAADVARRATEAKVIEGRVIEHGEGMELNNG